MNDAVITGILSCGVTLIVCLVNNMVQAGAAKAQHDKTIALIEYRIEELTKKVEKHNNLIERTTVLERDSKTAFKRIDELRGEIHEKLD